LECSAGANLPELGVGIVYTADLEPLIESDPSLFDVLEIEPQTVWLERYDRPGEIIVRPDVNEHIAALPGRKLIHSIGTPVGGSVPGTDAQLPHLRQAVEQYNAPWASEHLAFNLTPDHFTGFFLPPRQTEQGLEIYTAAIRRLQDALGVPIAFETGVNYLRPRPDEISDGEFAAELAHRAGCGILLDLHNVYANEWNGRQKVKDFVAQLPPERVWEIHLAGGFEMSGYWLDAHSGPVPPALFELSKEIIPNLPNLKAIVFEVFASFLPRFGLDQVRAEVEKLRELWALRGSRPAPSGGVRTDWPGAGTAVEDWERALGGLVVGRASDLPVALDLAEDPGVALIRQLIHEFRASMVVQVYRLSSRLMMLALSPDVFRAILEDFWKHEPPRQYAASEAEAFMAYLKSKNLRLPQLAKVMEFEKAAMDTLMDGRARVVRFPADPFPMLRALAEGRLPDIIPQEGDFEIEITPEGPVRVASSPKMLI